MNVPLVNPIRPFEAKHMSFSLREGRGGAPAEVLERRAAWRVAPPPGLLLCVPPTWAHRRVVRGRLSCRALFKEELEAGRFVSGLGAQTEKKSEM